MTQRIERDLKKKKVEYFWFTVCSAKSNRHQ
jgi:hypothetical protein